jgi:hypothetical protein
MVLIAASLYLPQHIAFLTKRAWFYYHGDETAKSLASTVVAGMPATKMGLREAVETLKHHAANKAWTEAAKEL